MSALDEMLPGSFRGVRFYVTSADTTGGRKVSVKQFIKSDNQSIEDLGLKPQTHTLSLVVVSSTLVNDYLEKKKEFIQALEKPGSGVLVHPFVGRLDNISVLDFTLSERLSNLGILEFTVVFGPNNSSGIPTKGQNTISRINNQSGIVSKFILTEFSNNYQVSKQYPRNFISAQEKLSSVLSALFINASFSTALPSGINEFSSKLLEFGQDINNLVNEASELGERISELITEASNLYGSLESSYEVMKKFFDFGEEETVTPSSTAGLKERNTNNSLVNYLVRLEALRTAYTLSSQEDYLTVNDVDTRANQLEEVYQDIKSNSDLSPETLEELAVLRDLVQVFFDNQKLNSKQIISVNIQNSSSLRLVSYQYYGSTELSDTITEINGDLNVSFVSGELEILTE